MVYHLFEVGIGETVWNDPRGHVRMPENRVDLVERDPILHKALISLEAHARETGEKVDKTAVVPPLIVV